MRTLKEMLLSKYDMVKYAVANPITYWVKMYIKLLKYGDTDY